MTISERVQASVRAANAAAREPVTAGAFTLYRHPASDHPYLNYAVPDAGATEGSHGRLSPGSLRTPPSPSAIMAA
jgi:hypothetical protein